MCDDRCPLTNEQIDAIILAAGFSAYHFDKEEWKSIKSGLVYLIRLVEEQHGI